MGKVIVANPGELAAAAADVGGQTVEVAGIAARAATSLIDADLFAAGLLAPRRAFEVGRKVAGLTVGGADSLAGTGFEMGRDAAELGLAAAAIVRAEAAQLLTTPVETVAPSSNPADNVVTRELSMKGKIEGKYVVVAVAFEGELKFEYMAGGQVKVTLTAKGSAGIDAEVLKAMGGPGGSMSWLVADEEQAERLAAQLAWAGARANPDLVGRGLAEGVRLLVGNPARLPRPQAVTVGVDRTATLKAEGVGNLNLKVNDRLMTEDGVPGTRHELEVTLAGEHERGVGPGAGTAQGMAAAQGEVTVIVGRGGKGDDITLRTRTAVGHGVDVGLGESRRGDSTITAKVGTRNRVMEETTIRVRGEDASRAASAVRDAVAAGDPGGVRDALAQLRDDARTHGTVETATFEVTEHKAEVGVDAKRAGLKVEGTVTDQRRVSTP